jgi:50S ribosomal subunit-associated GTPase HflX
MSINIVVLFERERERGRERERERKKRAKKACAPIPRYTLKGYTNRPGIYNYL